MYFLWWNKSLDVRCPVRVYYLPDKLNEPGEPREPNEPREPDEPSEPEPNEPSEPHTTHNPILFCEFLSLDE